MNLKELLEYKKELSLYATKVKNEKAQQVFLSEREQIKRNILRNSGKYSLNVWVRIFQEELLKNLGISMVLRTFRIKQEKVDKKGRKMPTTYQTYVCLIKNRAKILSSNYSPEFLEYLLATKFKQTFNHRIITHGGDVTSLTYNFTDLPKKLVGDRTYLESRQTLKKQVEAIIKRDSLIVLDVFTTVEQNQDAASERALNSIDYKYLKTKVSIIPTSKQYYLNKKFENNPKSPDEVLEKIIFKICDRQLSKNEKDLNQFTQKLDYQKIIEKNKKDYEFSMYNK